MPENGTSQWKTAMNSEFLSKGGNLPNGFSNGGSTHEKPMNGMYHPGGFPNQGYGNTLEQLELYRSTY